MNFLYILGTPLGYVMEWIYKLIPNYGWDIILFTLLIRILSIPLTISQQKSMASMSAFQPMIADIQKKYKNDQAKMSEEMTKLQQDYGYKPTGGCLPMFLNFFVMFGVIEVVYRPLQRIFHIAAASLASAGEALTALGISFTTITRDTNILTQVLAGESTVSSCFTADELVRITDFAGHMDFFGIDLTQIPKLTLAPENLPLLIFPILSLLTMFLSTQISMKASGQQMQANMKIMMYVMPLMFVYISFTMPVAFSLYYTISNILMTIQSDIMRRVYNPEKVKAQVMAQIEKKKKEVRQGVKSTVIQEVDEKTGKTIERSVSVNEMNRRRLELARQQDEERYKDERTAPQEQSGAEQAQHGTVLNGSEIDTKEE